MYASFDKSLFKNIDTLMELELDAWLLDARGEGEDYLSVMLTTYAAARNTYLKSSDSYELSVASVGALQEVARRPLKPGFFIANNTDYVFESQAQDHQQRNYVGKIIDSIKTKTFCIEAFEDISPGMYAVHTPEGKEKKLHVRSLRDVSGHEIEVCGAGDFAIVPWTKGLYVDCLLYRQDLSDS